MSLTKVQLEEQVQELETQLQSVRDELTERSFQLAVTETLTANDLEDLAVIVSGLASQLAWTVSTVQSIALYQPEGTSPAQQSAAAILKESALFWSDYVSGSYTVENLLSTDEESKTEIPTDEVNALNLDFDHIMEILRTPETDQTISDESVIESIFGTDTTE